MKNFHFDVQNTGINPDIYVNYHDKEPYDFFTIFLTPEVLANIVNQTNIYAEQQKKKTKFTKSRFHKWVNTNEDEIKKFMGIILWMGLARFPDMSDYWSKNEIKSKLSRNRFELLLRSLHFSDNDANVVTTDRLRKIKPLLEQLNERYNYAIVPGQSVCIDEPLVPFRGRLVFRQYIRNKRHKFGIKLYKLCLEHGYTYKTSVYCGKDKTNQNERASTQVVFQLMDNLLDRGRILYTDNFYTSMELAHKLLDRKTYLTGTLRSNRQQNCREVVDKRLLKGEFIARESNTGVVMMNWKDKRDVLTLSTRETDETMIVTNSRGQETEKPTVVVNYNKNKAFIDLSDQLKFYNPCLRRGLKWYRKLAFEFLFGTTLVNAHYLYREVTGEKISITQFKEAMVTSMLSLDHGALPIDIPQQTNHELTKIDIRRRCVVCYEKTAAEFGPKKAQSKTTRTNYQCAACNKSFCIECFFVRHVSTPV